MSPPSPETRRLLAGPHNTRLGPAIHAFNLPATPEVCVGASATCDEACYAKSFLFRLQLARHRSNHERLGGQRFAAAVATEVRRGLIRVVRIHTSGDFYAAAYVARWAAVARSCPDTSFFAYTRTWRDAAILPGLAELAQTPNVWLWFSEDRDTGRPPAVPRVRRAYLLAAGEAEADVPPDADLVFRVPLPRRPGRPQAYARPAKRANAVLICPKEQGIPRRVAPTCSSCRICFSGPRPGRRPPSPDRPG